MISNPSPGFCDGVSFEWRRKAYRYHRREAALRDSVRCLRPALVAVVMTCFAGYGVTAQATRSPSSELAERWTITFLADSASGRGANVTGSMQFADTGFAGTLDAPLDRLLDQPLPCYDPTRRQVRATSSSDHLSIRFTGTTADCDLSGEATLDHDGFTGTWTFYGYEGVLRSGRFQMVRAARGGGGLPARGSASSR